MKITDEMLTRAAEDACEQWLASYPDSAPKHTFSPDFERRMEKAMKHPYKKLPFKTLFIAALLAAMLLTVGTYAADSEWIGKVFHSAMPPEDGEAYTLSEAKDIEPVSEAHLALHKLPYAPALQESVGGVDLYIGNAHPVDSHYGCAKHGDDSHFVAVKEQLHIQRETCDLCGYKALSCGIETIETCLTDPKTEEYRFCDTHKACEPLGKSADDFEGWTVYAETEYTEWEEDRSIGAKRISPCMEHNHFAHDQIEQIRYAVTEFKCPDCPKIVPYAELQRRTVCYILIEGLTYAAEPTD